MAKNGVMAVNLGEMLERLKGLEGGEKPRTIDDLKKDTDILVRMALHGCPDEKHHPSHEAITTLIKETFKTDLLPDKVREPFARFLASDVLHHVDDDETIGDNLKALFNARLYTQLITMAYMVSALYERPDLLAPEAAARPVTTGQYL